MNNSAYPAWVPDSPIAEGTSTILFSIGSFQMHLYSFMIMLGFILSILTVLFFWFKEGWNIDILFVIILITVPAGIIGARLGFIIERLIYEPDNPFPNSHWYAIWQGGLSIQGGVVLAAFLDIVYLYTKRKDVDLKKAFGYILPAVLVGQFVGRFGNYANHEVYGKIDWTGASVLVFGKSFASNMYISDSLTASMGLEGAYRYPLFLYEGLANLIGYILICWVVNYFGLLRPGSGGALYLIWYGITRAAMEPLREESYNLYSVVAILFIIGGGLALIYFEFLRGNLYVRKLQKYKFVFEHKNKESYLNHVNITSFSYLFSKLWAKRPVA
ncbi:prolipoprotein diacylglyceryl transferase [Mycoplasma sp. 2248]|uniref:prolipoprotein diacylglyceryl transferase n=1 Tax=Mycoplasma sp. 2248 TaxID=3108528 RepID=UPI002B1E0E91|nr:prolipoprotein diacylglyceryl transferase [Mycoplasma sp. 2248]MEA4191355.1 prolipoprotein diacylglyceryl transferase [Mycoplasma sp. 2248]